jgi:hypothetical protein
MSGHVLEGGRVRDVDAALFCPFDNRTGERVLAPALGGCCEAEDVVLGKSVTGC